MTPIQFGSLTVGGGAPLLLIAGPCVIESESHAVETALAVREIARRVGMPYVFKAGTGYDTQKIFAAMKGAIGLY